MRPSKVCLCKSVNRDEIIDSIRKGNVTVEMIAADTHASTGCGTCKPSIQKIIDQELGKPAESQGSASGHG